MGPIKEEELIEWDDLVIRAKRGDWRAEGELFEKSKARLWAVYRNRNWQWKIPEDDAESIMHSSIAKAMTKYEAGGRYLGYLVTIFISDVYTEWLRPHRIKLVDNDNIKVEPASDQDLEKELLSREEICALMQGMKRLLPERRFALQLKLEGYKNREMSRFIPDRDINDLMYHAMEDLRDYFDKHPLKKD